MRSKVTVVLLFLNVVLFCYIYFYDLPRIDERKTLEARRRVLGPEAATIEALTRKDRTGATVRLEKRTDSWWLTAPYEWPADRNAIAGLINALELLEHETSFPVADLASSGRSLADYGLADPTLILEFTSSGRAYTLKIGDTTTVGNRLYVLSPDGARIHVVGRSLAEAVGLPLDTLRAASIFSVPVFEVRSLNVQTAAPANLKVRLRRDAASRWAFEAPINARASKAAVEVTINAVNALTAKNFLEPRDTDLDRAGLSSPSLRITLEGNARRETLLLGNPTGAPVAPREGAAGTGAGATEYFAKIEDKDVVFSTVVSKELLDVLRSAQEELRDPRVLDFEPAAVTALTLVAPGAPELTLQKLEGEQGWQAVVRVSGAAPQTIAADPGVVTTLLQKISQLSAREARPGSPKFLSDAPAATDLENWGFNRPEREITLNLSTGGLPGNPARSGNGADLASSLTLQIGVSPDKPGEAFARVTNAPFVYQILPDILDDTPALARHYRLRVLRELPEAARITSLKLSALPADTLLFSVSNEVALTPDSLATEKLPEKARTLLASLLAQLRTLRVKAYTAGTFTPEHAETPAGPQPWKYRLDVDTTLPGAGTATSATTTLWFTDRLAGSTMLAGTADLGGVVFEVTQEMLDTIFALTYTEKHDPGAPVPAKDPVAPAAETPPTTPGKP
ncbi:MAG TPA: DUF4340 domain-containing protein [Lacunisphaera sp.]